MTRRKPFRWIVTYIALELPDTPTFSIEVEATTAGGAKRVAARGIVYERFRIVNVMCV